MQNLLPFLTPLVPGGARAVVQAAEVCRLLAQEECADQEDQVHAQPRGPVLLSREGAGRPHEGDPPIFHTCLSYFTMLHASLV